MRPMFLSLPAVAVLSSVLCLTALRAEPRQVDSIDQSQGPTRYGDTLWVANRDADTLTIVEVATGVTVRTLNIGDGPHDIAISAETGKAYVMNELEDRIAVVSASTLQILKTISVPRPHHAKVSADGRTVVVGLFNNNQVAAIDTATDQVRIYTSSNNVNAKAHAPRLSRGGNFIFVPHEIGDDLTAIDVVSGNLVGGVNAGVMPTEVLPAADGRRLFVAMRGEARIKVFDLATGQVTGSVAVGTQPESLILTDDQRTLVVSQRGTPATMTFVNADTLTLLATVPIAGAGSFGDLAVMSPNGRSVFATFDTGIAGTGGVAVIDVQTGQKVSSWLYPGVGRPHGIAYSTTPIVIQ